MNSSLRKFRLSSIGLSILFGCSAACAAQPTLSSEQQAAVDRAREALAQRQIASADQFAVTSVTAKTWSDSSLGCHQPGISYAQMISEGYVVLLNDGKKTHEVRVAGKNAVTCDESLNQDLRAPRAPVRATHLRELEQLAREDLAKQLGADVTTIKVIQRVPKRWTEGSLQCRDDVGGAAEIGGFKLYLRHKMRTYTYHTDEKRVFACPVIAKE